MDALTREQYTNPWWTRPAPDNSDGPTALALAAQEDRDDQPLQA